MNTIKSGKILTCSLRRINNKKINKKIILQNEDQKIIFQKINFKKMVKKIMSEILKITIHRKKKSMRINGNNVML